MSCNKSYGFHDGLEFVGNNPGVEIVDNTMQNCFYGFALGIEGSSTAGVVFQMGDNGYPVDNHWLGNFTFKTALHATSDASTSPMYTRSSPPDLNPNGSCIAASGNAVKYLNPTGALFFTTPASGANAIQCQFGITSTNCGENWIDPAPQFITTSTGKTADLEMIAMGANIKSGDPDSLDILKVQQISLYKFLVGSPEWLDSSTMLNNFFVAMTPANPGEMKEIEQYLADRDTVAAKNAIDNYLAEDDIGDNYEEFYRLALHWEQEGAEGWEEQNREDLFNIAVKCSYKEGEVVFLARALYAVVSEKIEQWDDGCSGTTASRGTPKRPAVTWKPANKESSLLTKIEEIKVYPNPSNGEVHVTIPTNFGQNWQVHVSSVDGRTVSVFDYTGKGGDMQFSLRVSPGVYFVHVENSVTHREVVKKLLIK